MRTPFVRRGTAESPLAQWVEPAAYTEALFWSSLFCSQPQFAVRSEPDQFESTVVRLTIDEHQVGLDVTVAVILPLPGQRVIEIPMRQDFVRRNQVDGLHQEAINLLTK